MDISVSYPDIQSDIYNALSKSYELLKSVPLAVKAGNHPKVQQAIGYSSYYKTGTFATDIAIPTICYLWTSNNLCLWSSTSNYAAISSGISSSPQWYAYLLAPVVLTTYAAQLAIVLIMYFNSYCDIANTYISSVVSGYGLPYAYYYIAVLNVLMLVFFLFTWLLTGTYCMLDIFDPDINTFKA